MTSKKSQPKKETAGVAVLPPENTVEIKYNTGILLEKILEVCQQIKTSIDDLGKRFGGRY